MLTRCRKQRPKSTQWFPNACSTWSNESNPSTVIDPWFLGCNGSTGSIIAGLYLVFFLNETFSLHMWLLDGKWRITHMILPCQASVGLDLQLHSLTPTENIPTVKNHSHTSWSKNISFMERNRVNYVKRKKGICWKLLQNDVNVCTNDYDVSSYKFCPWQLHAWASGPMLAL
jgi:hypothetical protein